MDTTVIALVIPDLLSAFVLDAITKQLCHLLRFDSGDDTTVLCSVCREEIPPGALVCKTCKSAQDWTSCSMCREVIPKGALICRSCKNFQDWRRHFGLSSTILSLLVALVAVLNTTIPVLINAGKPNHSDVRCSVLHWGRTDADLVVVNRGTRPAVVKQLELAPRNPSAEVKPIVLTLPDRPVILDAEKSFILRFNHIIDIPVWDAKAIKQWTLELVIFPFSSEPNRIPCDNWNSPE
jgi:hypothetical protein